MQFPRVAKESRVDSQKSRLKFLRSFMLSALSQLAMSGKRFCVNNLFWKASISNSSQFGSKIAGEIVLCFPFPVKLRPPMIVAIIYCIQSLEGLNISEQWSFGFVNSNFKGDCCSTVV